jgi:hypothetical protein
MESELLASVFLKSYFDDTVQQISINHTQKILSNKIKLVFYDISTLYFETFYLCIEHFENHNNHTNKKNHSSDIFSFVIIKKSFTFVILKIKEC